MKANSPHSRVQEPGLKGQFPFGSWDAAVHVQSSVPLAFANASNPSERVLLLVDDSIGDVNHSTIPVECANQTTAERAQYLWELLTYY